MELIFTKPTRMNILTKSKYFLPNIVILLFLFITACDVDQEDNKKGAETVQLPDEKFKGKYFRYNPNINGCTRINKYFKYWSFYDMKKYRDGCDQEISNNSSEELLNKFKLNLLASYVYESQGSAFVGYYRYIEEYSRFGDKRISGFDEEQLFELVLWADSYIEKIEQSEEVQDNKDYLYVLELLGMLYEIPIEDSFTDWLLDGLPKANNKRQSWQVAYDYLSKAELLGGCESLNHYTFLLSRAEQYSDKDYNDIKDRASKKGRQCNAFDHYNFFTKSIFEESMMEQAYLGSFLYIEKIIWHYTLSHGLYYNIEEAQKWYCTLPEHRQRAMKKEKIDYAILELKLDTHYCKLNHQNQIVKFYYEE